jgi:hypothetical protein
MPNVTRVGTRTVPALAMIGLATLLTACGSTVQTAGETASGGALTAAGAAGLAPPSGQAPSGRGDTSLGLAGGSAALPVGSAAGSRSAQAGTAAATGSGGATSASGKAASSADSLRGSNGPGITAKTISIGIMYPTNGDAYQAALGNTAVTSGDVGSEARYLVKDINEHGGIAGRQIVPVYHAVDATSGKTVDQEEQAACADFNQDHHVFAMIPGGTENLRACMSKAGAVVAQTGGLTGNTSAQYDAFPAIFDATSISLDRLVLNLVPSLQRAKYFTPWNTATGTPGQGHAVTGIVVPDKPEYHHAADLLVRVLRGAGVNVSSRDVVFYHWPNSTAEDGQAITEIQSAVLKFKTDNVTHVIPLEVNGQVFFAQQADKQQYKPRYGINSASGTQAYLGSLIPSSQLNGAVGLGYFPSIDLPASRNPDNGPYSGPARRACVALMTRNGVSFSDTNAEAVALAFCDGFYQLKAIIEHVDPSSALNQRSVAAAIDSIGNLPSATYIAVAYGPHRRDAVSSGFQYQYFADCDCMHYTGARFSLS